MNQPREFGSRTSKFVNLFQHERGARHSVCNAEGVRDSLRKGRLPRSKLARERNERRGGARRERSNKTQGFSLKLCKRPYLFLHSGNCTAEKESAPASIKKRARGRKGDSASPTMAGAKTGTEPGTDLHPHKRNRWWHHNRTDRNRVLVDRSGHICRPFQLWVRNTYPVGVLPLPSGRLDTYVLPLYHRRRCRLEYRKVLANHLVGGAPRKQSYCDKKNGYAEVAHDASCEESCRQTASGFRLYYNTRYAHLSRPLLPPVARMV